MELFEPIKILILPLTKQEESEVSRVGTSKSASPRTDESGGFSSGRAEGKTEQGGERQAKIGGSGGLISGASLGKSPSDQNGHDYPRSGETGYFQRREEAAAAAAAAGSGAKTTGRMTGGGMAGFIFVLVVGLRDDKEISGCACKCTTLG